MFHGVAHGNLIFATVLLGLIGCAVSICGECNASMCPSNKACNITTLDECSCCHVCVRMLDESCGGAYGKYGVCQRGLECVLVEDSADDTPFVGICKVERDCSRVRCAIPTQPHCPQDSLVKRGEVLPGECCPQPDVCVCNECSERVQCSGRFWNEQLISRSTDTPGRCCDMYECVDSSGNPDCDTANCPPITFDCPWDSVYVASTDTNSTNSCCAIPGTCVCDPTRCSDVVCPAKYTKKLQSGTENQPGNCCDMYECVPDDGPSDVCVDPQTGLKYDSGEFWQRDPCTPCTCFSGAPKCYNNPCPRVTCANPVKSDSECCPKCPGDGQCGAFKCDLDCDGGYSLDSNQCPICHCKNNTACPAFDCNLECLNGYKTDRAGCEKCVCHTCPDTMKHCTLSCGYGYEKDSRGCTLCKCKKDSFGSTMPPERRRCYDNGEVHEEDTTWHPNQCTSCTCYSGRSVCSFIDCDHLLDCKNTVTLPNTCCPICRDGCVDSMQSTRKEGESWTSDCKSCSCNNGTVHCKSKSCPPLQCTEAVVIPGKCCPICPTVVQNEVTEEEKKYVVVIVARQGLHTMVERQNTILKHLEMGNNFSFTLKLLLSSDLKLVYSKSSAVSKHTGSIALVKAKSKNSKDLVQAAEVVSQLDHDKLRLVEPDIIKILTYTEYQDVTMKARPEPVQNVSKVSVGAIVGAAIASLIIAVILVLYGTRRYMILSHRRKFKHSASMGQSADHLITSVDTNRLTINFNRPRPSVDSVLSASSPTPSDLSPSYHPVSGHDNFASQYNPLSHINTVPEGDDSNA